MDPTIELADGRARATQIGERWELVADRGDIAELTASVAAQPGGDVRRWVVADPTEADIEAAAAAGLGGVRDVLQLRRPLPVELAVADTYPAVEVRSFRPGTEDEQAWIECNNRAFAGHADQAGFTLARLHRLMLESWFDPHGFLLHEEDRMLAGFCWTKVHDQAAPAMGEIFVIGIDPGAAGRGLGGALTLAGLTWLAAQDLTIGMLYVDADNTPARRMYDRLKFTTHHTDRVFDSESSVRNQRFRTE